MNEELNYESWVTISSSEESCDSDKIDSDIEAELYSAIHHESSTTRTSTDLSNVQSPQNTIASSLKLARNKKSFTTEHEYVNSDLYTNFETHTEVKIDDDNRNVKEASDMESYTRFNSSEVKVIKDISNRNIERKSDASVNNLYTRFETSDVIVTKECSNINTKSDASVKDLFTSLRTPEGKVTKDFSNRNAKRKSDVATNDLKNTSIKPSNGVDSKSEGSVDVRARKKRKITSQKDTKKESDRVSVLNGNVECESSDSDSILWSETDERDIQIQTNVEPEVVALSSDSFSDESYEPFEEVCSFRRSFENVPQPSTSFSSNDPWHINSDDLYRSKGRGKSSRYHERAILHCTNCNLKGHTFKFCSVPKNVKCFICGGDHMSSACFDKVCSKCFQFGHDARYCNQRFVDLCLLCNMRGHSVKYCPDLWRRFHLTTNRGNIVSANPIPQDSPLYCFNCGEQGHYGAMCRLLHPDRCNFQTWTSVIAHVHPIDTIKRIMQDQRHTALGGVPNWSTYQQRPIPRVQLPIPTPQKKKKRKKKPNSNVNLQTRSAKKKNKASSDSQTPENASKTKREFSFPRTPKADKKKLKRKRRKVEKEPFMSGLHRRLGISSAHTQQ